MTVAECVQALDEIQRYFTKSTSALEDSDSGFAPVEGMFTAAQQVAEAANTLEWFIEGALGKGWDMNFEEHQKVVRSVSSLSEARARLDAAFEKARAAFSAISPEKLDERLPADDPIMPGARRGTIINAIADHTAHHRGALTVYARLLGKTPPMPYM